MKIIDWLKSLISKIQKKENLLNEGKNDTVKNDKNNFVQKVDVTKKTATREEILPKLKTEIILKALTDPENYDLFKDDITKEYDKDNVLTSQDMEAVECIYKAIKEGNKRVNSSFDNKISMFLKQKENNIIELVNSMIEEAKKMHENIHNYDEETKEIEHLITDSYDEILQIIEEIQEKEEQKQEGYSYE